MVVGNVWDLRNSISAAYWWIESVCQKYLIPINITLGLALESTRHGFCTKFILLVYKTRKKIFFPFLRLIVPISITKFLWRERASEEKRTTSPNEKEGSRKSFLRATNYHLEAPDTLKMAQAMLNYKLLPTQSNAFCVTHHRPITLDLFTRTIPCTEGHAHHPSRIQGQE